MIQRMLNYVTINLPDLDLTTVTDIEVTFKQRTSRIELNYGADNISVSDAHTLKVVVPKADAMKLEDTPVQGQIMFTIEGVPMATKVFTLSVDELLKEEGYGN